MKKIIWTGIGFLLAGMNVNAFELALDARSGINTAGAGFVLESSGMHFPYPELAAKAGAIDAGFEGFSDAGTEFDYDAGSLPVGWSQYPAGYRLTAGMVESDPRVNLDTGFQNGIGIDAATAISGNSIANPDLEASAENLVASTSAQRSAGRDTGFKLAVGLGTTTLEPDIGLDAESNAGGLNEVGQAALLNETETETVIDFADFFNRPVLAIGVNYAF